MQTVEQPRRRADGERVNENRARRTLRLAAEPLVPAGPVSGFVSGTADSVRGVWRYRELLDLLVRRELKARYKDSALGFLWTLIRPLTLLLVYYIAIGKFLGAERSIPDFADLRLHRSDRLDAVQRDRQRRHRFDRRQRRPGQEDLPAARGLPAVGHRLGAVQLRHPVADPVRGHAARRRSARPLRRLRLRAARHRCAAGLRDRGGVPAVRRQRLPARRPVPGRDRADGRLLALARSSTPGASSTRPCSRRSSTRCTWPTR